MKTKAMLLMAITSLLVLSAGSSLVFADSPSAKNGKTESPVADKLNKLKLESAEQTPPELLEAGRQGTAELIANGFIDQAIHFGDKAPAFLLTDAHGKKVNSKDLLAEGPVVLVFYRGAWCPFCNLYLSSMQEYLPQIEAMGAQLVAVSGESPDNSLAFEEGNKLTFTVLSDPDLKVAKKFGIAYELPKVINDAILNLGFDMAKYYGTEKPELPVSATYVIQQDGTVAYSFVEVDYKLRAEPADVLAALEAIE